MYSKILCRAQAGKSFNETDDSIKLSCSDTNKQQALFVYSQLHNAKKIKSIASASNIFVWNPTQKEL